MKTRIRNIIGMAAAVVVILSMLATPVRAHVSNNMTHLWNHLKPYAAKTFYTKAQADLRYLTLARGDARYAGLSNVYTRAQVDAMRTLVWADTDDDTGTWRGISDEVWWSVGSVDISVPVDGCLTIAGSATIDNDVAAGNYFLVPYLDDDRVTGSSALTPLGAEGTATEVGSMSYSVTVPATAGAHVVEQALAASAAVNSADWWWNGDNLTVTFTPGGTCSVVPAAPHRSSTRERTAPSNVLPHPRA